MTNKFLYWTALSACFIAVFAYVQFNEFIFSRILLPAQSVILSVTVLPPIGPANNPPTITLVGDSTMDVTVNTTFTDPGATAFDDEDGDLTSSIIVTGTVNTSTVGSYLIRYTALDSGNQNTFVTRTVHVIAATTQPASSGGGGSSGGSSASASASGVVGVDLSGNGRVDLADFSVLAYWFKRPLTAEAKLHVDLNDDGKVDLVDFSVLAYYWNR